VSRPQRSHAGVDLVRSLAADIERFDHQAPEVSPPAVRIRVTTALNERLAISPKKVSSAWAAMSVPNSGLHLATPEGQLSCTRWTGRLFLPALCHSVWRLRALMTSAGLDTELG